MLARWAGVVSLAGLLVTAACGTAVYQHSIEVGLVHGAGDRVGIFDHQQGYSREWAYRSLSRVTDGTYAATLTTYPVVTIASRHDAGSLTIALVLPDLTDDGYFLITVDGPAERVTKPARFCEYGAYSAEETAPTIPVEVSARASGGRWDVHLSVDGEAVRKVWSSRRISRARPAGVAVVTQ